MRISLIQYSAGTELEDNFKKAVTFLNEAIKTNPDIICFPENFLHSGSDKEPSSMAIDCIHIKAFQKFAKDYSVNLILGSIKLENQKEKSTNSCLVINRSGEIIHRYNKIFMYTFSKSGVSVDEEATTKPGNRLGIFELDGVKIGVGICVDIRFPFYFNELVKKGAKVIFLPAVMRKLTGAKLWEYVPISRAIENQTFFCACSQTGNIGKSLAGDAVGNSKIISFDGSVVAQMGEEEGIIVAEVDLAAQEVFRKELPFVGQFDRKFT